MHLFLLKNALGERYKTFDLFFVIPLRRHYYPYKNEKYLPKPKFSVNIHAYRTKYASSEKIYGKSTFIIRSNAQVMNRQVINHSLNNFEQVMNKSCKKNEQFLNQ